MSFAFYYVENSINGVEQWSVTLYNILAQDFKLDFRFGPQPVSILTGLEQVRRY
jgi:hypothetical protein